MATRDWDRSGREGKAGLTPHSSEAGGTHFSVLCYNIIAYFGAGRELSVVAQACDLLGRLMQEDDKLKAIPGNSVRLNGKSTVTHAW